MAMAATQNEGGVQMVAVDVHGSTLRRRFTGRWLLDCREIDNRS